MARIICKPTVSQSMAAECDVIKKLGRCCDVFGCQDVEILDLSAWKGDARIGVDKLRLDQYLTWYYDPGDKVRFRVGRYTGSINWAFSKIFDDSTAELHTLHGLTDDGEYDYHTTTCIRVCVGEDGWPMVRIHWSDADTHLWEDWYQSDREAVDMAAAVCRQPENEGIYLDWLEDRLGVAVRDRDEMMRFIVDKREELARA